MLAQMAREHPDVKGIRRQFEFDDDPRSLSLSPAFIEGINLLEQFGYHFEFNVKYTQMDFVRDLCSTYQMSP